MNVIISGAMMELFGLSLEDHIVLSIVHSLSLDPSKKILGVEIEDVCKSAMIFGLDNDKVKRSIKAIQYMGHKDLMYSSFSKDKIVMSDDMYNFISINIGVVRFMESNSELIEDWIGLAFVKIFGKEDGMVKFDPIGVSEASKYIEVDDPYTDDETILSFWFLGQGILNYEIRKQ